MAAVVNEELLDERLAKLEKARSMAAFLNPADAVAAALAMRSEIAGFNRGQPDRQLILKIGIHKGAAIAVTLNERLDYFGQTVNIVSGCNILPMPTRSTFPRAPTRMPV